MDRVLLVWRDISLQISAKSIYSFNDISMQFGIKTKSVTQAGEERADKEATKAQSLSMEIPLFAEMGVNVEDTIKLWRDRAQDGGEGNIYIAGHDLIGKSMMLVQCDVSKIRLSVAGDKILGAVLKLKFTRKQLEPPPPPVYVAPKRSGGGKKKPHYIYTTSPEIRNETEAWLKKNNMKVPGFNGVPLPPKVTRGSNIPNRSGGTVKKTYNNTSKSKPRKKSIMNRTR